MIVAAGLYLVIVGAIAAISIVFFAFSVWVLSVARSAS